MSGSVQWLVLHAFTSMGLGSVPGWGTRILWKWSCSVVVDSLWPHGPVRLLHPWNFPGKDTRVGCHFLLQGIFPTPKSNPDQKSMWYFINVKEHPYSNDPHSNQSLCQMYNNSQPLGLSGRENYSLGQKGIWCKVLSEVSQSCPTLCDPTHYNLPGSSVHGIFQARVLEWVAISFSRGKVLSGLQCC